MANRSSTMRERARAHFKRIRPACHICGGQIDFALPHLDPASFVVDHVVPLHRGGVDALSNMKAAHRQPGMQQQKAGKDARPHR